MLGLLLNVLDRVVCVAQMFLLIFATLLNLTLTTFANLLDAFHCSSTRSVEMSRDGADVDDEIVVGGGCQDKCEQRA